MSLKTYTHAPASGGKPKSIVFLLHGLGANGMDLLGLAPYFARKLPNTVFVSPDAPFPCDMAPVGFQWFSLQDWSPHNILEGVRAAEPILNDYISKMLEEYNLTDDKAALVGFSQGTMMSLYTGPRRKNKIAGVLGYSGALIGGEGLNDPSIHKVPVHLIHGESDSVVPVSAYHAAREVLTKNGFTVTGNTSPYLMHNIDESGIESGADFLSQILA